MARIDAFLKLGLAQGCSDIHLAVGVPPMLRMRGELMPIKFRDLSDTELESYVLEVLSERQKKSFEKGHDLDFAYVAEDGGRYRVNVFRKDTGVGAAFRYVPDEIPTLEGLGLPDIVRQLCDHHQGMVLVTGATGSGKSTSLAAMIDKINRERNENIITVEDPIEFIHQSKQSLITQREVGRDTQSFGRALKGALRQDPDIILMGELRDYETVSMAMTAAETGHLVFGTLHTNGAPETINRIVDVFPATEQPQARSQLSQSLRLVLTQQLLKRKGGGRIGAFEVMVNIPAVANLIRESKIVQIETIMQTGASHGMVTMTKYLEMLEQKNLIE